MPAHHSGCASTTGRRPPRISHARRRRSPPLAGIRVLDFSWVIAGPTATRYLAAMGADVIKIEAPGRGDPGRASELHSVLGQAKRAIVLDLKKPEAIAIARALAAKSDVLVENFATGVMDRLGLGADELRSHQPGPDLRLGLRARPQRSGGRAVAYGTLLQCYAGFAGLNRHPEIAPRVGLAWLDPMCGLMLAFITARGVVASPSQWRRRARRFFDARSLVMDDGRAADRDATRRTARAGRQQFTRVRATRRLSLRRRPMIGSASP